MKPAPERYTELFKKLQEGKLSPAETNELITWLGSEELDPEAARLIMQQLQQSVQTDHIDPSIIARLENKLPAILGRKKTGLRIAMLNNRWMRYAAILVLFLLGTAVYLFTKNTPAQPVVATTTLPNDIAPGREGAILTLVDGRKVVLDSLGNGVIADQNGAKVLLKNGQLVYNAEGNAPVEQLAYNTMSTPRGRQFRLVLPDGTNVWLNAASSITYPTVFKGNQRNVEITGEAYFEVAKNPNMPFHVKMNNNMDVEVLGTHFNVNTYNNEDASKVTLLEGSVRLTHNAERVTLKPGEQAQIGEIRVPIRVIRDIDVDKVMAWKNGVFDFNNATLEEVMRQLERWYDIDIAYEKEIPRIEFVGKMGRDLNLSTVLRGLELSKVHFKLVPGDALGKGRKLIVLP